MIIKTIFLILISFIKFVESCMDIKLLNCQWKDPCKKIPLKECLNHKECTIGDPDDPTFEVSFQQSFGGYEGNQFQEDNLPPNFICKDKEKETCHFNIGCSIF